MKQILLHRVPNILACGTDQKHYFQCLGQEQGSIFGMWDVEHPRFFLLSISILNNIEIIGMLKEKLCQPDIALVCLWAIASQEVGRNHVLDNIRDPGSEERHIMLFLECSTEVQQKLHYQNKREIPMHNSDHPICKNTRLGGFHFYDWEAIVSRDAPHQPERLNLCNVSRVLKVTERLKPMFQVQENLERTSLETASYTRRSILTRPENDRRGKG